MADIFVSYKKEDAGRVVRIVEGLRTEGFDVWWDHGITPGAQWDQTIQRELNEARMVVAVWSDLSISAPWVKEEAGVGKSRGALLPVRIDDVEPPLGFGLIQMADLIDWDGDTDDKHWTHFLAAVKAVLSGDPVEGLERPVKRKNPILAALPALLFTTIVIGGGVAAYINKDMFLKQTNGPSSTANTDSQSPAPPNDAEQAVFAKAQASTLRDDYLDYLRIYPQGAYADKIRDTILPFCEGEKREYWGQMTTKVDGSSGQTLRGVAHGGIGTEVGSDSLKFATREAACTAAKADVENTANTTCQAFVRDERSRNAKHTLIWPDDCDCEYLEAGETWMCSVDPQFVCDWETLTFEFIQVCK